MGETTYTTNGYDPAQEEFRRQQLLAAQQAERERQAAQAAQAPQAPSPTGGLGTAYIASQLFGGGSGAAASSPALDSAATAGSTWAGGSGAAAAPVEAGFMTGTALPVAGAIYTGYRGYKAYDNLKNKDASVSNGLHEALKPGNIPLALGTMGMSIPASIAASLLLGQHNPDKAVRGKFRRELENSGFAISGDKLPPGDSNSSAGTYVPLADGSLYDISNEHTGQSHSVVNPEKEWSSQAQGWAMPIAAILNNGVTGNQKLFSDTTAQLTNAMRSNTSDIEGIRANALSIFERLGIDRNKAIGIIKQMGASGAINPGEVDAYIHGINTMFDGKGYTTNAALSSAMAQKANPQTPNTSTAAKVINMTPPSQVQPVQGMANKPGVNLK